MSETGEASSGVAGVEESETAHLLKYLESHDAACPLCKYNLRGLTVPRCPECGKDLRLTVGLREPVLLPYITLMVSTCLPAGMGIIGWIQLVVRPGEFFMYAPPLLVVAILGFMASTFIPPLCILLRRKFLRLSVSSQWKIALISLLEPLALFGILIIQIFSGP